MDKNFENPKRSENCAIEMVNSSLEDCSKAEAAKAKLLDICAAILKNPQILPLTGGWVPQVISNALMPCIMCTEFESGYLKILKRITLSSDLSFQVSTVFELLWY